MIPLSGSAYGRLFPVVCGRGYGPKMVCRTGTRSTASACTTSSSSCVVSSTSNPFANVDRFTGVKQPRVTAALVATVVVTAGCSGDPYARYAATLHQDVDAAMVAAFQMTARLQLTVVHNQIPDDSLPVARDIVMRTAHAVDQRAAHFRSVIAPGDLARVHADLSLELSQVAAGLDSLGAAFQRCAAADPSCQAHLDSLAQRFSFMGEDLNMARSRVQRLLQAHGILLRRVG